MEKEPKIPFTISEAKKKEGRYCCAYACTNPAIKRKSGLCHRHYRIKRKAIDKVYDRYNLMKCSATQRNLPFRISLQEFRDFCKKTGYIINKGYRGRVATIDRIIPEKGYTIENIQILSLRANVKKYHEEEKDNDCPF